jgi:hypothetical protein
MRVALLLVLVTGLAAAQAPAPPSVPTAPARKMGLARPVSLDAEQEVYGAALAGKDLVALKTLIAEDKAWHGKVVQVRGRIHGVCEKKGCWMIVRDGDQEIRVRFTGYKFFVPLDVVGREVAVEGLFERKVETEAERRHYAEDAGKSAEEIAKITGDLVTHTLTADSVHIGKLPPAKAPCCGQGEKKSEGAEKKGCCGEGKPAGKEGCCGSGQGSPGQD